MVAPEERPKEDTTKGTESKPARFTIYLIQAACDTVCMGTEEGCRQRGATRRHLQSPGWVEKVVPILGLDELCVQRVIFESTEHSDLWSQNARVQILALPCISCVLFCYLSCCFCEMGIIKVPISQAVKCLQICLEHVNPGLRNRWNAGRGQPLQPAQEWVGPAQTHAAPLALGPKAISRPKQINWA